MSSTLTDAAASYERLDIPPTLVPVSKAFRFIGLSVNTIKRLEAADPAFPRLIRLSTKRILLDIPATTAYLQAQAGKAPRSMRGEAAVQAAGRAQQEQEQVAQSRKGNKGAR